MSELAAELGLRLVRVVIAALIGAVIYVVLVGPVGAAGSAQLALESFIAGALVVLLLEKALL